MAKQFKTGILITANASGAIKSVQLTSDELKKLNTTQKKTKVQADKTGKSMKDYAGKLGLVSTAATALAGVIGGFSLASTVRETVALTKETNAWASAIGVSTQEMLAFGFAVESLGLGQEKARDILKDLSEKIGEAFLNGSGEAVEVLDHLNLAIGDLVNMSPDEQILAIAGALDAIESTSGKIQIMESLASDASLLIPLLENDAELLKQLKQEAIDSGVALSAIDTAKLTELDVEFRKASAAATGLGNQITVALSPAIVGFTQNVTDIIHSITEFVSSDSFDAKAIITGFSTLAKIVSVGGALYIGLIGLPVILASASTAWTFLNLQGAIFFSAAASGVPIMTLLNTSLFGTSVAATAAAGSMGVLKVAAGVLFAAFAGWEIGTWIRDNFVEARIAGLAFVGAMVTGWEHLKFGAGVAFAGIKATWNTVIQFLRDEFADFLDGMSKGVGFLDRFEWADKASKSIGTFADSLRKSGDETETLAQAQARLKKEMTDNINTADAHIVALISYELELEKTKIKVDELNDTEDKHDKIIKKLTRSQQDLLDKYGTSEKAANEYFDTVEALEQIMVDFPDQSERVYLALQNLHLEYDKGAESAAELTEKTVKLAVAAAPIAQIYEDTASSIRSSFSGAFRDALDGQNSFADRMKNVFKDMLADMATMAIARPIIIPMVSGLGSLLGVSAEAQAATAVQMGGTAADTTGLMAEVGETIGAGMIGYMAGGAAAKIFDVGNPEMAATLTAVGAMIAGPWGAAIGFVMGSLLKGNYVTDSTRYNLDYTSGLGVSGFSDVTQIRKGGLLSGDDTRTIFSALDAELTQRLSLTFDQFETGLARQLNQLDIGNLAGLTGFTSSTSLDITGLDADQVTQVITQWVGDVTVEMAAAMLPGLDAFRRAGESGVETIERLTESLNLMVELGRNLDITIATLIAGSDAAAQYGIQIEYATADIIDTANQLANTRDMQQRIELEQQYADQVMERYQLEQQMLTALQQTVLDISADVLNLRAGISGDISSISGGAVPRDPAAINADLLGITTGAAPDLSIYLALQDLATAAEAQYNALLSTITGSNEQLNVLYVERADFESDLLAQISPLSTAIQAGDFKTLVDAYLAAGFPSGVSIDVVRDTLNAEVASLTAELTTGLADYDTQIAALLEPLDSLRQEYEALLSSSESLQSEADAALTEYNATLTDFLGLTGDQVDQLQSLREETLNYYNAMLQLDKAMSSAAANIGATLESLRLGSLTPAVRLDDQLAQFTALSASAETATGFDLVTISEQLNDLVNPLLSGASSLFASGQGYQDIFNLITSSLGDIEQRLITEAPQDYEESSLALLTSIDDLLSDMQDVLTASEQAIIDAINTSRLHTVGTLEDIRQLLGGEGRTLASFDIGTAYVPSDMQANIHQGEVIIDPQSSDILRRYGIQVSGGGDAKTLQVLNRIERLLAENSGDLRLTVVTPDGRIIKEETISDIKKRSQRGESIVHTNGVFV